MALGAPGWHRGPMLVSRTSRKPTKDEARQLLSVPFALTRTVRVPEQLRRVRIGEADGRRIWTFDLAINAQSVDHGTDYTHDNYSAAVVQLPVRIDGRVALARKGLLRNPEEAVAPEVDGGTEELRRRFRVRSSPGELAERLLDERVCEWLTGPGRGFHFEIVHDRVLAYGWRRWLGGTGPLRAALGLATELTQDRRQAAA
jgi:hypothetical protein